MSIIETLKAYLPLLKGSLEPDYNLESVYDINTEELQTKGIKGLFFDLDSTITISKSSKFSDDMKAFIKSLEEKKFKLAIISNNRSKEYVEKTQKQINIKIYYPAEKPQTKVIEKAMADLGLKQNEVAMIGDRPVTDILAGKNAGLLTVLVDGIDKENENKLTRLVRHLERLTIKKN